MKSLFLVLALAAPSVWAQTTPAPAAPAAEAPAPGETKVMKKIVVMGSYIKKVPDQKAPTPVTVTDKTKIIETSSFTVAGAFSEDVGFSNDPDDVFLSLHGQTDADNLVLMNGLRLPKTAGGSGVNIDFIPALALERTETLKDGASALYGSEALAGVVNIVTTKEYVGTNLMYRLATPEHGGGQEVVVGLSHGDKIGKHNYMVALQFRHDTPRMGTDDRYAQILDMTNPDAGGDPYAAGVLIGDAGLGTANCPPGNLDVDGFCRTDMDSFDLTEDRNYYMTYATYGYDFSETLKLSSLFAYTKRSWVASTIAPIMDLNDESALGRPNYSIPIAIANGWGTTPTGYTVNPRLLYRATDELGNAVSKRDVDNYVAQVDLTKSVGNWDVQLATGYGFTFFRDVTLQGNARKADVFSAINTGAFNPFKAAGSKDNLRNLNYESWFQHTSDTLNPKVIATGPLTNWLSMAAGVESQFQSFKFGYDPLTQSGGLLTGANSNQKGSREVYSGFLELDFTPIKQLELQLAGRFDEYSDFGSTINPKIGIAFHASEKLTLRASYGTGFKAPDLLSIYQGRSTNPLRFRDEKICAVNPASTDCTRNISPVTTEGNKNLDPETAVHYNVGAVVTPTKDVIFGADYWHVDGEDGLSQISPTAVTIAQRDGLDVGKYGISVTRDPITDKITNMYIPARVNAGIFRIRGIDFIAKKRGTWNSKYWGPIGVAFSMDHSHILSTEGRDFETEAIRGGYNLGWNNIIGLSFSKENNFVKFQARTTPGGDENTNEGGGPGGGVGAGSTNIITLYDVHYERFLKNDSSIHFGIKNILNTHATAEINGTVFRYGGDLRNYYLGYTKEF